MRGAIRLGRLVRELTGPSPPAEATGLVALMLLHDARRPARLDDAGDLVVLEEQDRSRWDQRQIGEALPLVEEAFRGKPGPYAVQAAIAALHCRAARAEDTDWMQILRLYDVLERLQPSPIVSLNRAVAVAMAHGPEAGLAIVDALAEKSELGDYHLLHSARADLMRRMGSTEQAAEAYAKRWRWLRTKANGAIWSAGCAKCNVRRNAARFVCVFLCCRNVNLLV